MTSSILAQMLNLDFQPCLKDEGEEFSIELCTEALEELKQDSYGDVYITFRGMAHHLNVSEKELTDFMLMGWYDSVDDEEMEFYAEFYEDCGLTDVLMEEYPLHCERELLPIEWLDVFSFHFKTKKANAVARAREKDKHYFDCLAIAKIADDYNKSKVIERISTRGCEKTVSDNLAKKENGKREVQCKHGRIDVVTDKYIIEVKEGNSWKNALGQLAAYHIDFPKLTKRLHLFNYYNCDITAIDKLCKAQNVILTLEADKHERSAN